MAAYIPISAFVILTALAVSVASLQRGRSPKSISISVLCVVLIAWGLVYAATIFNGSLISSKLGLALDLFFQSMAATAAFAFSAIFTRHRMRISRRTMAALMIEPVLTQVFYWIPATNLFFFSQPNFIWLEVQSAYNIALLSASGMMFIDLIAREPRKYAFSARAAIAAGAVIPLLSRIVDLIGDPLTPSPAHSAGSYALALLCFYYIAYRARHVETLRITREDVMEGMPDAWMIVDTNNLIVDLNPAAEEITGKSRNELFAQPIQPVLSDYWPQLVDAHGAPHEFDMKRTVKFENDWRQINTRISHIKNDSGENIGYLISFRDITHQRLVDNARERSRNEMLLLFNEIFSAANHSESIEDFLTQTIYQIIYPFRSQAVAFYLAQDGHDSAHRLAAQAGFSPEHEKALKESNASGSFFKLLKQNDHNRPLNIDNLRGHADLAPAIRKMDYMHAALIPLTLGIREANSNLGFLCMMRTESRVYTQDELIRLETISKLISGVIENDRRRQIATVQTERQRLMRDLHDSASQKLYGLVALSEAAQAALDVGAPVDTRQLMNKIGSTARDAVGEMRLFVYQMLPVDLETKGLVAALQDRILSVESRSNISPRLLSDESIQLSKKKEAVLFHIASEGLNNIVKHAQAKNVLITITQNRNAVTLQIKDDGKGFKQSKLKGGGHGLNNMQSRALEVNGKYKLTSKPGEGTVITVSIPKKD